MDAVTPAVNTTRHEVFVTDGELSMRWKLADSGITLTEDGLSWSIREHARERPYSEIYSVRLQRAAAGTGSGVGICQIMFRDGLIINIHGGNEYGVADDDKNARYAAFVRDLHKRLASRGDCKRIVFRAGLSSGRYIVLTTAIVAAGILFGLLPLGLLIMIRDLHTLVVFISAAGLFWSFYKLWDKNRPRPYSPGYVPEELLS